MYKQFYCHDYFPISSRTWDLESWRSNVPWGAVLRRTGDSAYAYCNYDSGGTVLSLDAYNYPRMRVSAVRDGQAALVPASIARGARFRVVVGLAGAGNSLQEINALGQGTDYYLRHRNGQVMLQKAIKVGREHANRVDPLFAADASFHVRTRQGAPSLRAFQSYNYTDHFIRHFRGRLEIGTPRTRPGTPFAADRYFIIRR